jgi:single-strand DNA-binding protein
MSMDVNRVTFLGNVGKDPEVRVLPSGMVVANFSVATNERVKDQRGEFHDRTEWHNLVALDRRAEVVRDYVRRGSRIYIEGKQQTRSWDDRTSGEKKYRTEVLIGHLILLSPPSGNGNGQNAGHNGNGNQRYAPQNQSDASDDFEGAGITDDDIPFEFR